jgi:tetratricopeptide (TPR) repeat protein
VKLTDRLTNLESAQLLRRLSEPELAYIFKHILTQETAYGSLLRKSRGEIHRLVAQTYEQLYGDRLDEYAPLLARHYAEAGDDPKALEYARRAGDAAARVYAHVEAIAYYTQALELAQRDAAGAPPAGALLEQLYHARAKAWSLSGEYEAALADFKELAAAGRQLGDRALELSGLIAEATVRAMPNPTRDPEQARALLEQSLALARELGDQAAEARVLWSLCLLHTFGGEPRAAIPYGEESLVIARRLDLREQMALTLNGLSMAYWPAGQIERAHNALDEAQGLWRELDNLPMLVEALARLTLIHFNLGDYDQALALSDEGSRISRTIGDARGQANSLAMVGHIYLERGEVNRAIEVMEEAISAGERSANPAPQIATRADLGYLYGTLGDLARGFELARLAQARADVLYPVFRPWATAVLARLYLLVGDVGSAGVAVTECYRDLKPEGSFHTPVWVALADGELALAQGEYDRAAVVMERLLTYLEQIHTRPFRADALNLKGQALLAMGQPEAARRVLELAREEAEALGSRRTLWQILLSLSETLRQAGDEVSAALLGSRSRELQAHFIGCIQNQLQAS